VLTGTTTCRILQVRVAQYCRVHGCGVGSEPVLKLSDVPRATGFTNNTWKSPNR
jgi:hypothetical protein